MLVALLCQLPSYSLLACLAFAAVTFVSSSMGGAKGLIVGHCLIAAIVTVLDIRWVQDAMATPTYNRVTGADFDILFPIGVLMRVVLVVSVLLPLAILGIRLGRRLTPRRWQGQSQ